MKDAVSWLSEEDSEMDSDSKHLLGEAKKKGLHYGSTAVSGEQESSGRRRRRVWWDCCRDRWGWLPCWKMNRVGPTPTRTIHINTIETNLESQFCSNRISTTKYNFLSFLPLFLYDQFRRYANLFFLLIVFLQQIPGVSPTGRFTTAVPLFLVLLATAVKELIEDYRRHKADNEVNRRWVKVFRCGGEELVHWTKVVVGDIVEVRNKEFFPSDLLLLCSSEPQGICYIETSNLDGETNLKIRQAHPDTMDQDVKRLGGRVECEGPNNRLYEFTGNLQLDEHRLEPIQADQILLRGAQLRNTQWVRGLVLYTGHDSKLLQNASRAPLKRSNMDRVTNRQVVFLFIILLLLSLASSIGASVWNKWHVGREEHWYLPLTADPAAEVGRFFKSFLTFIILYNNLIPISLIVTLEVIKFLQAYFINYDQDMYDAETDTPALARNSNLNEELGQVKYIFSDKTGTLTENIMDFKKCTVAGQVYGMNLDSVSDDSYPVVELEEALQGLDGDSTLLEFMKVLALCHTVIPEREEGGVVYRASSPDEGALVRAAKDLGVVFEARTPDSMIISVRGHKEEYKLLNLLEFNSTRKRMSVIVRTPDGQIKLFCKGADTVIYDRLLPNEAFARQTESHLEYFAVDGLRTLCIAEATIDEQSYQDWNMQYRAASTALDDREKKLDLAAEQIEKDLHLLGATAIEDKLQERVPESIALLRKANIKIWVLTGDKQETAITIGYSSRQLTKNMTLMVINVDSLEMVQARIQDYINQIGRDSLGREQNAAVIIDGKSLHFALDAAVSDQFLELALACKSVICCRVTPKQKADVVELVRTKVNDSITLAIGDGANDVSMIQAAHVGVGISGREGLQATLASDYAISQFRFLVKLLLVHGAWNYNRLAKLILYSFYKNICLYMIEFWFAFLNGFSGQPLFERWTIGLYNVIFTIAPPIALGLFDQDVSAKARLCIASLYHPSQARKGFNSRVFWKWIVLSIYHSLALFLLIYFLLGHETAFENGKVFGLWYVGNTVYTAVVITVCLKAGLEIDYWICFTHLSIWGSIVSWFLFVLVYAHFWPTFPLAVEMVGQDFKLFASSSFYALFVLGPAVCILPDLLWTAFQKTVWPTEIDKERMKEIAAKTSLDDYERGISVAVSYSVSSPDTLEYEDRQAELADSSIAYRRGYAFSQEDHDGLLRRGSSRVQRREMIRMYDTTQDGTSI